MRAICINAEDPNSYFSTSQYAAFIRLKIYSYTIDKQGRYCIEDEVRQQFYLDVHGKQEYGGYRPAIMTKKDFDQWFIDIP